MSLSSERIYVYVAGPMRGNGERAHELNCRDAYLVGTMLLNDGYFPFVPHSTILWNVATPMGEEAWMQFCFAWLERCDCLLRLDGYSAGADREVEHAIRLGIPVFYSIRALQKHYQTHFRETGRDRHTPGASTDSPRSSSDDLAEAIVAEISEAAESL